MLRAVVGFLCIGVSWAQPPAMNPVDAAIQAVYSSQVRFGPMVGDPTLRDAARQALADAPIDSPQYGSWAHAISRFYGNGLQARAVLEEALARTESLPKNSVIRITLLTAMSDWWQQDRNLLQALSYAEQVMELGPALAPPSRNVMPRTLAVSGRLGVGGSNGSFAYQRVADLYRRLGRPDEIAALTAKLAAQGNNAMLLESLYEREGKLDEAEKILQNEVQQAANPQESVGRYQALSSFYRQHQRYDDAVTALQQAISAASSIPARGGLGQNFWLRQDLAGLLQQAGKTDAADAVYQQLLSDAQSTQGNMYTQTLSIYANYLGSTNRAQQGETLLNNYVSSAHLEPWEQINVFGTLSNLAARSGDQEAASKYRKQSQAIQHEMNTQVVTPQQGVMISETLQKASTAANAGKIDDAFTLVLEAIGEAPSARDRFALVSQASNVAFMMAVHKGEDRAQQIWDRLFTTVATWDDPESMERLYQNFAQYQENRQKWTEAADALEKYREVLIANHGPGTGWLEDYYRRKIQLANRHLDKQAAAAAAREFLKFEVTLSGDTSEPYLNVMEVAAPALEAAGAQDEALALYRREVKVVDLVAEPNSGQRAMVRSNVALALAHAGEFEEAETLALQAAAISKSFGTAVQTVQKLKAEAEVARKQETAR